MDTEVYTYMSVQTTIKSKLGSIVEVDNRIATVLAIEDAENITVRFKSSEGEQVVSEEEITLL